MSSPEILIDLSAQPSGLSLSAKLAEAIADEIRRGRFAPGARLPSSRKLALQLSVHRNTVIAAMDDLVAQGYVRARAGSGVFVSDSWPQKAPLAKRMVRHKSPVVLPLPSRMLGAGRDVGATDLPLLGGLPDLRLAPTRELARAYKSALADAKTTLDYQSPLGEARFLRVFARFLAETRGVVTEPGELLTTRGSQQALHLAGLSLCAPGQVIAVEALGYPAAWDAFRLAGAELRPLRVDRGGLVVSELAALAERERVAAVYVTPHHQYPTTVTMSGPRRAALLELARQRGFYIIEDDYDHEFHFQGRPVLPLASFDSSELVVHIGTFSKVFAPGLRLGYVAAPARIVDAMVQVRRVLDRQGDHTMERALSYLIEDGVFEAHLRRMHRVYKERREVLLEELSCQLGDRLSYQVPHGGLAVWARVHAEACAKPGRRAGGAAPRAGGSFGARFAQAWAEAAARQGVVVQPARELSFDARHRPYLRLGFPRLAPPELRCAVQRLSQAWPG